MHNAPHDDPTREPSVFDLELARALCRTAAESRVEVHTAIAALSRHVRGGHTCFPLAQLIAGAGRASQGTDTQGDLFSRHDDNALVSVRNSPLVSSDDSFAPLRLNQRGHLYFQRHWRYERDLASQLLARFSATRTPPEQAQMIAKRLLPDPRAASQRHAVEALAVNPFTVISGGPGTGKTTTVAAGLATLIELAPENAPPSILVAAPTGKAAGRIASAIAQAKETLPITAHVREHIPSEAVTLHRALGQRPFTVVRPERLEYDAIVVDEASMVDLELMAQLVGAVEIDTKLILVGDPEQLASVQTGAVMKDIVRACQQVQPNLHTELTSNFRFQLDSDVGRLAAAIRSGDARAALRSRGNAQTQPGAVVREAIDRWRQTLEALSTTPAEAIAAVKSGDVRPAFGILCPFRTGRAGTNAVNNAIDAALDGRVQPILIERNDHDLGVWNGDFGYLLSPHNTERVAVIVRAQQDPIVVPEGRLPPYSLAYATTVHKAQGSEFDEVVVLLPDHDSAFLTRELLYTGVTRGRRSAHVVGADSIVAAAIRRVGERYSGLYDALVEPSTPVE